MNGDSTLCGVPECNRGRQYARTVSLGDEGYCHEHAESAGWFRDGAAFDADSTRQGSIYDPPTCDYAGCAHMAAHSHALDGRKMCAPHWRDTLIKAPHEWIRLDASPADDPRGDLLRDAEQLVNGDRNNQYGDPRQDFQRTAAMWGAYLGIDIAPHDVAALMSLLKLSRIRWSPGKRDSWTDLAGYAACGWDCARDLGPDRGDQ